MGLTVGALIDRTKQELMGGGRSEMNVLAAPITTAPDPGTIETWSTTYPLNGIVPGTLLTIDDEMMYVFSVNQGVQTFTVARGESSTTPAGHDLNARIYVNDPFPRALLLNAMQDEIRSWGPQVFAWDTITLNLTQGVSGYDLGSIDPWFSILDVRVTPDPNYYSVDTKDWGRVRFKEVRGLPTSDFPSGNGVIITQPDGTTAWTWNIQNVIWQVQIVYSHPFDVDTQWDETVDIVGQCGLDPSDQDIPQLGTMWRILRGREARRAVTNVEDTPASDQQVPPLYITKTAAQFKAERDSRLNDAQVRLARQFPLRRST